MLAQLWTNDGDVHYVIARQSEVREAAKVAKGRKLKGTSQTNWYLDYFSWIKLAHAQPHSSWKEKCTVKSAKGERSDRIGTTKSDF